MIRMESDQKEQLFLMKVYPLDLMKRWNSEKQKDMNSSKTSSMNSSNEFKVNNFKVNTDKINPTSKNFRKLKNFKLKIHFPFITSTKDFE